MSRISFCAILLVLAFAFSASAQQIPFKMEKGYLLITGKIQGDLPFEAAVYTGNLYSFYNESSLKKLRLFETNSNDIPDSGISKENALTLVYVPQITVADQKPVELRMLPRHEVFDAMSKALGRKIDFILGADYFEGRIVQIDFRSHVISFLDRPTLDYASGIPTPEPGAVRVVFRMAGHVQSMFGTMMTLPVADEVTLNGNKVPSLLNTGVIMPITARPSAAKKLTTGKDSAGPATISKVVLGDYEMTDVPVRLDDVKDDYDKSYNAIIGLGLLQNFTITFDWKNKWIVLEK